MNILCPFCNDALLRGSHTQGPYAGMQWDAPLISSNHSGYYVTCSNQACGKEVRMSPRIGWLTVSPGQAFTSPAREAAVLLPDPVRL